MIFLFKVLHLLGVIFIFGHVLTSIFWKSGADKSNDPKLVAHIHKRLLRASRIFSYTGLFLIFVTGFGLVGLHKLKILHTQWVLIGVILLALMVALYIFVIQPFEKRMANLTEKDNEAAQLSPAFYSASRVWYIGLTILAVFLLAGTVVMVYRPV